MLFGKLRNRKLRKLIIDACENGDLEHLKTLTASNGPAAILLDDDPSRLTALHHAAAGGSLEVVGFLLAAPVRADPSASRRNNFTPLHAAAMFGHTAVCEALIAAGADVNTQTQPQGYSPLHSAAFEGHEKTIALLLQHGADPTLLNHREERPADTAKRTGKHSASRLLETGADNSSDTTDEGSGSPMIESIAWGEVEVFGIGRFRDVKVWPGGARSWDWQDTGTRHVPGIQRSDVEELVEKGCEVILLSRGMHLRLQTQPETIRYLESCGIEVIVAESKACVKRYNELATRGVRVGALIHSTC